MSQYGVVEPSSDYETSDTGTNSLNNSLSEEEFTAECSNIESDGLKLMISFRKRSCDDEVDNSPRANLSKSVDKDLPAAESGHMRMERQIDCYTISNEAHSPELSPSDELSFSNTGKSPCTLSLGDHDTGDISCFTAPASPSSAMKATATTCSSSTGRGKSLLIEVSHENITAYKEDFLDVFKTSEVLKPLKRAEQVGSTLSSANDVHDPLLRLDTLPNVSPDSGIISLDESPYGNDSPSSLVNGDVNIDPQHGSLMSCSIGDHHMMASRIETVASIHLSHEVAVDGADKLAAGLDVLKGSSDLPDECKGTRSVEAEDNTSDSLNVVKATVALGQVAAGSCTVLKNKCAKSTGNIESVNLNLEVTSQLPISTNGNGIIISSPHKISQAMGRKKRGRPPKKKNSLLFKHKKSTLYSSLYGGESISERKDANTNCENNKGSIIDNKDSCHVKQTYLSTAALVKGKAGDQRTNVNCDSSLVKTRTPGRPKGSLSKNKAIGVVCKRTFRNSSHRLNKFTPVVGTVPAVGHSKTLESKLKRPRGRPRKNPLPEGNSLSKLETNSSPDKSTQDSVALSSGCLPDQPVSTASGVGKTAERKVVRRRVSIQRKSKNQEASQDTHKSPKLTGFASDSSLCCETSFTSEQKRLNKTACSRKLKADLPPNKVKSPVHVEKSVFQDNDLDALLKSVKSSINSQFANDDANSDILSFENPFRVVHPTSFPKIMRSGPPGLVKPKSKKPKLHVMMRRTKRKKRKKLPNNKPVTTNAALPNRTLNVFDTVVLQKKFTVIPQGQAELFTCSVSDKRLSFFNSLVQPSKILASSRLNVFRSGTGVDGPHRSGSPIDIDQLDCADRRGKKRHRLLYRKSKHRNIIDPVFAADLDTLVIGLSSMSVCENPADNFIRVRPGEVPLPSIFRVIKIDVNKKVKDRIFNSENYGLDKSKQPKPRKDTPSPYELPATSFKPIIKGGRKKSSSDQPVDHRELSSMSDSSDQCLPPKKRHRLVNMEATLSHASMISSMDETAFLNKDLKSLAWKRRGRRPRKLSGVEENKPDEKFMQGRLGQLFVDQALTIDTSSFSVGGSSVCTPSLSPCPSRLSTRSSTMPSLSSPSPTGSSAFRNRPCLKGTFPLACPLHSSSHCLTDRLSCAECRLLEQSASPGILHPGRTTLRSLSVQASESSHSSERPVSSSEPSPIGKETLQLDRMHMRSVQKHKKSPSSSVHDSDSSPPRLQKNTSLSPNTYHSSSSCSDPPEITGSHFKRCLSPRRQCSYRESPVVIESPISPTLSKKICSDTSPQRSLRQPSTKSASLSSVRKLCNKSSISTQSSSKSVIQSSHPECEPLPLEHCTKRKLVEEIQAATAYESDDDSSFYDKHVDNCDHPAQLPPSASDISLGQPPRKRFQRVGLFSDFYKDEEPRKRCENMVKCRDKLVYVKEEHEFGLIPQPLHIGQYYMRQNQDFQLPYDIWWQHIHQQLPKKPEPKIKFRTIRTNVYSDSRVSSRKLEVPLCNCIPLHSGGKGCGDDCLNRMIYAECSPSTCPVGENCGNQKIQKHEWAPGLEKFLTKDRGFGVRTRSFIRTGNFILEYLGEVVSEAEFRRRMMEEYSEECHHYALHLDSGSLIDGYRMGNVGRYVNHSCQPNCEMQKWNVNGLYRMVLFALRDIEPGEELSYDYNFDSFNQETQQECRCGSSDCRGVIGVKTQRNNNAWKFPDKVDDCKDKRKSKLMNKKLRDKSYNNKQPPESVTVQPLAKPLTFKERCYARKHRTFLVRNVDKVRNQRNPNQDYAAIAKEEMTALDCNKISVLNSDLVLAHLNERSVKTRLAAYTKDNPEMAKRHQLAQIFDKMLTELLSLKDEDGYNIVTPLMSVPPRKKQPQYYQVVKEPIDLSMIKQRVKTGYYDHLSAFNSDVMLLFSNVELYCGPKSKMGQVILKLRRVLNCVKVDVASQIDELLGSNTTKALMDAELEKLERVPARSRREPEEDIVRCICGVTRDEGLMLQCEKCLRWQHCDCVQASGDEEHYLCDRCEPRYYDPEILLVPPPLDALPDCTHYMTLLKDDVQYAVGDCVYVMRDCKRTSTGTPLRASHRLMATVNPDKLDIFRLDQLWKDPKGEKFASGTPYLRPQETFHEPTRKFYHNELFRTPNLEIVPMELIMGKCVVMDPAIFIKGRPKGVKEQDVYICEYRVDKTAHLFHKIQKIWYPINTSKFCFDWFDKKISIKRTYLPHKVPEEYKRKAERNMAAVPASKSEKNKKPEKSQFKNVSKNLSLANGKVKVDESIKGDLKLKAEVKVNVKKGGVHMQSVDDSHPDDLSQLELIREMKRKEKKHRLDKILTKLLNSLPGKQKVDLTYLLDDGKRIRKKVTK